MEPDPDKPRQQNQHYSVDEMLDRLKQSDRAKRATHDMEEGELITRPDGSQVIKVRKRKRRSRQSAKKTNRRSQRAVLMSLVGLLVVAIGGMVFIIAKYNGSSFKDKTEATISAVTGATKTELTQLKVSPLSATASEATLTWANDSYYHSANFSGIKAGIKATSFLSSNWIGEEIVAQQGDVRLQIPSDQATQPDSPIASPYRFDTFRCNKLNLRFGLEQNAPSITASQVSLGQNPSNVYQVLFNGGVLQIPQWPAMEIASGILTLNPASTAIEARLAAGAALAGEIVVTGDIARHTASPVKLHVQSRNFPIQELLGKDLGRIIQGDINSEMGTLTFDYSRTNGEALDFVMPFNSNELSMSELPMLTDLEALTGDSHYTRPTFSHCKGTITRSVKGMRLDQLYLISSRLLTLQGGISVDQHGLLEGELEVGLPARLFGKNRPAPAIFSAPRDGYVHTKVSISGSIHNPHDDLNDRLRASRLSTRTIPSAQPKTQPLPSLTPEERARQKERDFEELTR